MYRALLKILAKDFNIDYIKSMNEAPKLNKDGTPRKKWTQKNPRKNARSETYIRLNLGMTLKEKEVLDIITGGNYNTFFKQCFLDYLEFHGYKQ